MAGADVGVGLGAATEAAVGEGEPSAIAGGTAGGGVLRGAAVAVAWFRAGALVGAGVLVGAAAPTGVGGGVGTAVGVAVGAGVGVGQAG